MKTSVTTIKAMQLLAEATMSPFMQDDWHAFAGCNTPYPLIGYRDNHTVVLDGEQLLILADGDDFGGQLFQLGRI